jgi:hypothetical protein
MKQQYLKKMLVKVAVICALLVAASGGAWFGASLYDDAKTQERDQAKSQLDAASSENQSLRDRIIKSSESYKLYENMLRYNPQGDFSLSRESASKVLAQMKDEFPLTSLDVSIQPVKNLTIDIGNKKSGTIVYSEVRISFSAATDTNAFRFIRALELRFPGVLAFQSVKLTKKGDLTGNLFQTLSADRLPDLVAGEVIFNWIGIRPPETTAEPHK